MGAFINLNRSSVSSFTIQPPKSYIRPEGLASCMGTVQGGSCMLQTLRGQHMHMEPVDVQVTHDADSLPP